ncbi:hypothetical protein QUB08_31545, partial [Microcoleus sp. BR0-C5]|uniref:hypothetical protein n=1 Tax=Microcoleus sp. BR0-C5 TaxID=2818713 RepID=UPI002FCEF180
SDCTHCFHLSAVLRSHPSLKTVRSIEAELNPDLYNNCNFTPDEISSALRALSTVSEKTIIQAVAAPPSEWGLTLDERVTLVEYLTRQQHQLLTFL